LGVNILRLFGGAFMGSIDRTWSGNSAEILGCWPASCWSSTPSGDEERKRSLGWLTAGGSLLILAISWMAAQPGAEPQVLWGGMLRQDWLAFIFKSIAIVAAGITSLLAMDVKELGKRGEFYILLLTSTIGICLMAASADLIMLFLAIETTSIPLYVLAGFFKSDDNHRSRLQIPVVRRHDLGGHALRLQPAVRFHQYD
jgi:formate hydrogenlyase subunit 3/multisubunit Na+/H+ antiporter MnhD subunit